MAERTSRFEDGPLGFCLDTEDEDQAETSEGHNVEQSRVVHANMAVEQAAVLKATRLMKRLAKAWIWNRSEDLQGCLRQCKGIKRSKHVLVTSGIYSFIKYKADAIAPLIGYEYTKQLDALGREWTKVIKDETVPVTAGKPLGEEFTNLPQTFKKRCETIVEGLQLEEGSEIGSHLLQKIAMALVVRGVPKYHWIGSLIDDQISRWLARFELAGNFVKPIRDRLRRRKDQQEAEAKARLMVIEERSNQACMSKEQLDSLVSQDRLEMLEGMIKDSAEAIGAGNLFNQRPTKVFETLAKIPNQDSAKDLLNLRTELCFLSTKKASMASAVSAMNCWASFVCPFKTWITT